MFRIFFFNDTATTEIYTLSLHDALPISHEVDVHELLREAAAQQPDAVGHLLEVARALGRHARLDVERLRHPLLGRDRKSTRLNSSHANISYAVFCLKKKTYSK